MSSYYGERQPLLRFKEPDPKPVRCRPGRSTDICADPTRQYNVQGDDGDADSVIARVEAFTDEPILPRKSRLISRDMFPGLTMVGMILVKNQGSATDVLTPFAESCILLIRSFPRPLELIRLDSAAWEGLRLADIVFPCFLFIAGLAISLAMRPLYPNFRENSNIWRACPSPGRCSLP